MRGDVAGGLRGEWSGCRKLRRCGADAGVLIGCPGPSGERSVMEGGLVGKPEAGERGEDGADSCFERLAFLPRTCGVGFDDAEVFPALGADVALGDGFLFEEEAEALEFPGGGFGVVISDDVFDEWGKTVPGQDRGFFPLLAGGSAVDQPGRDGLAGQLGAPVVEAREEVGCDGLTGLDFDGMEGVRCGFDEGVDFVAFLVAEKVQGGFESVMGLRLEEFGHHPVFEQGASLGMCGDV